MVRDEIVWAEANVVRVRAELSWLKRLDYDVPLLHLIKDPLV
jgi:hypothetical protein